MCVSVSVPVCACVCVCVCARARVCVCACVHMESEGSSVLVSVFMRQTNFCMNIVTSTPTQTKIKTIHIHTFRGGVHRLGAIYPRTQTHNKHTQGGVHRHGTIYVRTQTHNTQHTHTHTNTQHTYSGWSAQAWNNLSNMYLHI
jgi:hypothetical protein